MLAMKTSPSFLGNSSPFRARRGHSVPARMRHMAAQAYAITLKMPDGEKTIDVMGEHSRPFHGFYHTAGALVRTDHEHLSALEVCVPMTRSSLHQEVAS